MQILSVGAGVRRLQKVKTPKKGNRCIIKTKDVEFLSNHHLCHRIVQFLTQADV